MNIIKLLKNWWKLNLKAVDALIWWHKNSIITEESYSAKLMKNWPPPLKILMIVMWPIEWIFSLSFLLCSVFILGIWFFIPIFLVVSIISLFLKSNRNNDITGLLGIWAYFLVMGVWVWIVTKIPEKLKKFR